MLHDGDNLRRLRPVADGDATAMEELIRTCWSPFPTCVLHVDAEEPWLRAPATRCAAQGKRLWVVDDDPAEPAGHPLIASVAVKAGPEAGEAELKTLYVWPGARRRGLGEALIAHVEAFAKGELGASRMVLWSDVLFLDAHRLYERLGYLRGPTRELHDRSATVEFFFARELR
ncbi:MAG: GNAT family N-acetyltransferase [Myxococcales bacterium]|nr:GNAT family N-acetyltransferase [Myxococcales bacterium]